MQGNEWNVNIRPELKSFGQIYLEPNVVAMETIAS